MGTRGSAGALGRGAGGPGRAVRSAQHRPDASQRCWQPAAGHAERDALAHARVADRVGGGVSGPDVPAPRDRDGICGDLQAAATLGREWTSRRRKDEACDHRDGRGGNEQVRGSAGCGAGAGEGWAGQRGRAGAVRAARGGFEGRAAAHCSARHGTGDRGCRGGDRRAVREGGEARGVGTGVCAEPQEAARRGQDGSVDQAARTAGASRRLSEPRGSPASRDRHPHRDHRPRWARRPGCALPALHRARCRQLPQPPPRQGGVGFCDRELRQGQGRQGARWAQLAAHCVPHHGARLPAPPRVAA
mmetsp:Transcript_127610/g.190239  ORF Transcript_127610/g.190239 Transcript_127610/m.190239 type:complete len:303 (-) Transcript_127610:629-1537(-)